MKHFLPLPPTVFLWLPLAHLQELEQLLSSGAAGVIIQFEYSLRYSWDPRVSNFRSFLLWNICTSLTTYRTSLMFHFYLIYCLTVNYTIVLVILCMKQSLWITADGAGQIFLLGTLNELCAVHLHVVCWPLS
jgi:hypothetical protein